MPSLIGNKPNQVPSNGDLGTMAFREQDQFYSSQQTMGFKNRIINGAMMIDQRNAGASVLNTAATGVYFLDRYYYNASIASKLTYQQSSSAPAGFSNAMSVTVTSAATIGSGDFFTINQPIEANNVSDLDFGLSTAKTITVSFWVKSSITGTFCGDIRNAAGNRDYVFTYTISAANTWEQKTVTIAGDTTGTWNRSGTSTGLQLRLDLGSGSSGFGTANTWNAANVWSVSGSASSTFAAQAGATFYITGVQLEKGSTATSFDYRPYGTELQLCQRYYETLGIGCGGTSRSNTWCSATRFAVPKRASPTLAVLNSTLSFSNGSGTAITLTGSTLGGAAGISANGVCQDIYGTFSTSPTTGLSIVLLTDNAASVSAEL
jgi:hypothetical protein